MKKILIFVVCLVSCLFVGCDKEDLSVIDEVKSIEACSEFYDDTFFVGDIINLEKYTVLVTYDSGTTETMKMSSFGLVALDTTMAGERQLELNYKQKIFTISYVVSEIMPIAAMYKGDAIEFYRGEDYSFSNIYISVLFNNGVERNISLVEFELGCIDYSLTLQEKYLTAVYQNIQVYIPYTVNNRPIVMGVDYHLNDNLNIFNDKNTKIRFTNEGYIVHSGTEVVETKPSQQATKCDYNRYWSVNVVEGQVANVAFYLVGDTIFCEIYEE